MGESVQRGALRDRWRIRREGRLIFAEDVRLEGAIAQTLGRSAIGAGARAAATVLVAGGDLADRLEPVRALAGDAQAGAVELGAGVVSELLVVRLLSPDAQALRRVLVTLLGHLTGRALPRTWST
jgi:urease accessory protein